MGGFSKFTSNQASKTPIKYGSIMPSVKVFGRQTHTWNNQSNQYFTKEMKDNTHLRNFRDAMMVSLQEFLKYNQNVPTHIISTNKLLPCYSIRAEHIVLENIELKSGVRQTV